MSKGINKAIIIGYVGQDPVMHTTNEDLLIAKLSIATSFVGKDKVEGTDWHRIVAFGKLAGVIQQYVKKGQQLYIEGAIKTRKWTDKSGIDRYSTEILADTMQMLGKPKDNHGIEPRQIEVDPEFDNNSDIPF